MMGRGTLPRASNSSFYLNLNLHQDPEDALGGDPRALPLREAIWNTSFSVLHHQVYSVNGLIQDRWLNLVYQRAGT